jgi:hypothetical protein
MLEFTDLISCEQEGENPLDSSRSYVTYIFFMTVFFDVFSSPGSDEIQLQLQPIPITQACAAQQESSISEELLEAHDALCWSDIKFLGIFRISTASGVM